VLETRRGREREEREERERRERKEEMLRHLEKFARRRTTQREGEENGALFLLYTHFIHRQFLYTSFAVIHT
jgi:hypothetical protein